MQIVNLGELINKMGKGELISQDDLIDVLGSFLKDADVGEVHVHNCSKCGSNVHSNSSANHHKKCEHNSSCAYTEDNVSSGQGSDLSDEDTTLLNFAAMYIAAYKAGNNMEEYRKFFIDNVLPVPTLQGIAKYIK